MTTPTEVILKVKKNIQNVEKEYVKSNEFESVAKNALIDFIKRVKRSLMPDLSKILGFEKDDSGKSKYIDLRKKNAGKLGDQGKATKSNATATGQMLSSMKHEMKPSGFTLLVQSTQRNGELNGSASKLTNKEVAKYYSIKRNIFDFSKPEIERIKRKIRQDLLQIIRRSK